MKQAWFILVTILAFATNPKAQVYEPVKWKFSTDPLASQEFFLVFEATIDEGWYLYSQFIDGDGPVPTSFTFDKNNKVTFVGKVSETGDIMKEGMDEVFGIHIKKFAKRAVFKQRVKVADLSTTVSGVLEFMTCDDEKCLPPAQIDFSFSFPKAQAVSATTPGDIKPETSNLTGSPTSANNQIADSLPVTGKQMADQVSGFSEVKHKRSIWGIFIAGFIGGLLALLTPCVFPIIPMTVSFFSKTSKSRQKGFANALLYAISIVVIYVGLGFAVTKSLGADALNDMASNVFFNMAFFVIFVIFAISFFGYFEITLPSSFITRIDRMSDRGGLIGIFFMAFTLTLVSFSCTGPIIGTLLVEAAIGGSNTAPLMGMFGFSLALALPFGLFAAFPGWLNSLPKSGSWLNSVKVVLGFLELGLALKFLSNVDLAYHWGFLKREIFLGIWLVLAVATGLYILGKIKFPHDSPVTKITPLRWFFAGIFFAFALYLVPGLKGANLKLLSGFPPPAFYSIFETKTKCPHNIPCFKDLNEGMEYAKKVNKPVMLDFTGWSCVNCRKMEENVWVEPEILKILNEKYVLVSLYVDDKTPLPETEQRVSTCTGKKIRTIGNKWSEYQTCTYKTNTQPYYVLLSHTGRLLNEPVGYTPDAAEYKKFLEEGLKNL
jgi:thiol:disulfide interchange protein DsbD